MFKWLKEMFREPTADERARARMYDTLSSEPGPVSAPSFDRSFQNSMIVGAVTNSTLDGAIIGGDIVGAAIGDLLGGDD